jgi:hypothetical protein
MTISMSSRVVTCHASSGGAARLNGEGVVVNAKARSISHGPMVCRVDQARRDAFAQMEIARRAIRNCLKNQIGTRAILSLADPSPLQTRRRGALVIGTRPPD